MAFGALVVGGGCLMITQRLEVLRAQEVGGRQEGAAGCARDIQGRCPVPSELQNPPYQPIATLQHKRSYKDIGGRVLVGCSESASGACSD